jgi:hypothetical protein
VNLCPEWFGSPLQPKPDPVARQLPYDLPYKMLLAHSVRLCYNAVRRITSREVFMDLAFWRDLSVVLLCLEAFVLLLIPGALFFLLLKGLRALEQKMREFSPKVQGVFRQVNRVTRQVTDKIAEPVIKVSAATARAQAMRRRTASLIRRHEV